MTEGATRISLSWPSRTLSPNGRPHWRTKAAAVKKAKEEAYVVVKQARLRVDPGLIPLVVTFHPKTRNKVDIDNLAASMKSAMDGIAQALGVDDAVFRPTYQIAEPVTGGLVVVEMVG